MAFVGKCVHRGVAITRFIDDVLSVAAGDVPRPPAIAVDAIELSVILG